MDNKEKQLQGLVRHEAKALRRHATTEEKNKLDFKTLETDHSERCVYGQMTGNCWSTRAIDLIEKCASRVIYQDKDEGMENQHKSDINGSPLECRRIEYFSPIEVFIAKPSNKKNNKNLIEYIKGNTNELNFE